MLKPPSSPDAIRKKKQKEEISEPVQKIRRHEPDTKEEFAPENPKPLSKLRSSTNQKISVVNTKHDEPNIILPVSTPYINAVSSEINLPSNKISSDDFKKIVEASIEKTIESFEKSSEKKIETSQKPSLIELENFASEKIAQVQTATPLVSSEKVLSEKIVSQNVELLLYSLLLISFSLALWALLQKWFL